MAYSSRCSGATAEAMRAAGWGMLLTPQSRPARPVPGMRWCLDNGAWGCYVHGHPWDEAAFTRLVEEHGPGADWIAAPDIVAGGLTSLRLSESWIERLAQKSKVLIPVQDGMTRWDIAPLVGCRVGVFVGGSTGWKLSTLAEWGKLGRDAPCHVHVARVNSCRRIQRCHDVGAHSFDGSSVSRFRATLARLDAARRSSQLALDLG